MGELRNRLDRKNELRLYEWMKSQDNYRKLSDKTVTEGARAVSDELNMRVSASVLTSLVQAMGLEPFWKTRNNGGKREDGNGLASIQRQLEENARKLDVHDQAIGQLKAVCENIVNRLEKAEERGDRRQRRLDGNMNGAEPARN